MGIIYIFLNENDTTIFQLGHPLKFEVRQNAVEMIMAYMFCISPLFMLLIVSPIQRSMQLR